MLHMSCCRIKLELLEDVDLAAAAQRIVEGSKLLHASRLAQVHALLEGARRQHQLEPDRQPEQLGMGPSARVSPDGSIAAPFLALSRQVSERDRQLLREEQQHALAAAAAALRAAAATASLDRLEDYLVGACCLAAFRLSVMIYYCKLHLPCFTSIVSLLPPLMLPLGRLPFVASAAASWTVMR